MPNIIILSGPSGIGKTFTSSQLVSMFPNDIAYAPTHTTRPKRTHEGGSSERIITSKDVFTDMVNKRQFFIYEEFAGHFYGITRESLQSEDKHLIVDLSPYLLPTFANHSNVIIVGLQAPQIYKQFLANRMQQRGDSAKILATRAPFIQRDIEDLQARQEFINRRGRCFQITDNNTIPEVVLPWIIRHVGLSPLPLANA